MLGWEWVRPCLLCQAPFPSALRYWFLQHWRARVDSASTRASLFPRLPLKCTRERHREKHEDGKKTAFDFSLEMLPYFNIEFNRLLCLKEITVHSDSPAFKKYILLPQSKTVGVILLLGFHLQWFLCLFLSPTDDVSLWLIDCSWFTFNLKKKHSSWQKNRNYLQLLPNSSIKNIR